MKNNRCVTTVVFEYLKILLKDENKSVLDFLSMVIKNLKSKLNENQRSEDFLDIVEKRMRENEKGRKFIRKSLLEELLKSEKDEEEIILLLIELIVIKNEKELNNIDESSRD